MDCTIRKPVEGDFKGVFSLLMQLWPDKKLDEAVLHGLFSKALSSGSQAYLVAVSNEK